MGSYAFTSKRCTGLHVDGCCAIPAPDGLWALCVGTEVGAPCTCGPPGRSAKGISVLGSDLEIGMDGSGG